MDQINTQEIVQEKATQVVQTDNNGHATFTIEIGPKSDLGVYDTECCSMRSGIIIDPD